jgi:hypothetical protein
MKKLERLAQVVGMQFEEAVELFCVETLETMQMVSIVGSDSYNPGCTVNPSCTVVNNCNCTSGSTTAGSTQYFC